MPEIQWKAGAKIPTKAIGLEGRPYWVRPGEKMKCSDAALKHLKEIHPGLFTVVGSKKEK